MRSGRHICATSSTHFASWLCLPGLDADSTSTVRLAIRTSPCHQEKPCRLAGSALALRGQNGRNKNARAAAGWFQKKKMPLSHVKHRIVPHLPGTSKSSCTSFECFSRRGSCSFSPLSYDRNVAEVTTNCDFSGEEETTDRPVGGRGFSESGSR